MIMLQLRRTVSDRAAAAETATFSFKVPPGGMATFPEFFNWSVTHLRIAYGFTCAIAPIVFVDQRAAYEKWMCDNFEAFVQGPAARGVRDALVLAKVGELDGRAPRLRAAPPGTLQRTNDNPAPVAPSAVRRRTTTATASPTPPSATGPSSSIAPTPRICSRARRGFRNSSRRRCTTAPLCRVPGSSGWRTSASSRRGPSRRTRC